MIVWNILKQKNTLGTGCNRILSYQGVFILNGKSHWISYKWRCFDWKLFPFENTKLAWVLCVDKNVSSTHTRKKHTPTHTSTHQPYPPTSTSSVFFPHPTPRSAAVIAVERVIEVICKLYSCKSWSKPWCPKNSPKNHHHHLGNPPTERVWFGRCSKLGKNICPWPSSIYRKSGVAQMIFFSDCPKVSLLPKQKDFENQRVNHLDSHVLDKTHQCQSLKEMKETSQMGKSLLERSAFYGPLPVRRRYTHKLHLSLQVPAQLEDGHE